MPFDINAVAWTLRLDTTRVTSGSDVTSWTDLSGNGKNLTGSGPTTGVTTPTGEVANHFDGTNDKFTSSHAMTNFVTDTAFTIHLVASVTAFSTTGTFYTEACLLRDNGGYIGINTDTTGADSVGAWVADTWPWPNPMVAATGSTWYCITLRLKTDGTLGISTDGGATWQTDTAGDAIGSLAGSLELGYGSSAYFSGDMAAVYILDSAQSDADVADTYAYLSNRFIASTSTSITDANVTDGPTVPSPTVQVDAIVTGANVTDSPTIASPTVTTTAGGPVLEVALTSFVRHAGGR